MPSQQVNKAITKGILGLGGAVAAAALFLTAAPGDDSVIPEPPPAPAPAPVTAVAPVPGAGAVPAEPLPAIEPSVPATPAPEPVKVQRPRIDVVFALDTTGSMSGLIQGAKMKIWSLANEISSGQPKPIVRFGLVGYRDRSDAYVTKSVPLTRDMDELYDHLMAFSAGGGGDTPEHVNEALRVAIDDMKWSRNQNTLKLIFLVGDAPPHDDYDDGLTSRKMARKARARGIIVNTIRAGRADDTRVAWQRISRIAGGEYASIAQSGGVVATTTPYDGELERLNRELASTGIAYGHRSKRSRMRKKVANRMAMKGEVAASAAGYGAKNGASLGDGDLVGDMVSGSLAFDDLEEDKLPEDLRKMSKEEQKAHIEQNVEKRKKLRRQLADVSRKRDAYLKKARKAKPSKDSFDRKVMGSVAEQAASVGVHFD